MLNCGPVAGIPVSSVGHARTLAEEGNPDNSVGDISISSLREPPSPSGGVRKSLGGGGTTKVLADLQAGVLSARTALENTKSQLRASQRSVAQVRTSYVRGDVVAHDPLPYSSPGRRKISRMEGSACGWRMRVSTTWLHERRDYFRRCVLCGPRQSVR